MLALEGLNDAPRVTPSMRSALENLNLSRLHVLHAGRDSFPLGPKITALPLARVWADLRALA